MKTAALATSRPAPLAVAPELAQAARAFAKASRSEATKRAYRRQWEAFTSWCEERGFPSLPASPEAVALYVADRAESGWKVAGLAQALAAISVAHVTAGHPSPRGAAPVREVLAGIRRTLGTAQRQAAPLLAGQLRAILEALPGSLRGLRDRALLLVGFAGAFRRSELVSLTVADARFTAEGLELTLRRSKTDQEGAGHVKALPYSGNPSACPVRALQAWLEGAGIKSGPLFREVTRHEAVSDKALSDRSVARIVKGCAAAAGLEVERLSGHSLRAGFATQAARAGKAERAIQRQTGHRSVTMLRRYIREAERWTDNAAAGLLD
jgi:site-specific recombinase XerD